MSDLTGPYCRKSPCPLIEPSWGPCEECSALRKAETIGDGIALKAVHHRMADDPIDSMVEQVAKALRDSDCGTGSQDPWEDYVDDALAAVAAMEQVMRRLRLSDL